MDQKSNEFDALEFELGEYLEKRMSAEEQAEIQAIDNEIWSRYGAWVSILYTDLSGFSKSVYDNGILYTLEVIFSFRAMASPIIQQHGGVIAKTEGDSLIVIFDSAEAALNTALDIRKELEQINAANPHRTIYNACGIGYGRVLNLGNRDVFGMEVNLASRLGEDIAKLDEILLTESAKKELERSRPIKTEPFTLDEHLGLRAFRLLD